MRRDLSFQSRMKEIKVFLDPFYRIIDGLVGRNRDLNQERGPLCGIHNRLTVIGKGEGQTRENEETKEGQFVRAHGFLAHNSNRNE